ncbi:MAG TPA: Ig-like domain-containing protein [Opitutus sp.]|nr:Ig-like domain-containing protein [Opitutus sp.]
MFDARPVSSLLFAALAAFCGPARAFSQSSATPIPAIPTLTLINAATQQDLRPLTDGSVISLVTDGTALNVRADVHDSVACVAFYFDGKAVRTENSAPYAFAADTNGVYSKWRPPVGTHTLRAIPYSKRNQSGVTGVAVEVTVNVIDTAAVAAPAPVVTTAAVIPAAPDVPLLQQSVYKPDGSLNLPLYGLLALSYDKATMEYRLGPAFDDLHLLAADTRPALFQPASKPYKSGYIRVNPYELGDTPATDSDYWSDSGQVGYVPDVETDPGLDRIQTYAYYDHVFATSPRLDWPSGTPHPDPQTSADCYAAEFGELPKYPVAMARNYGMQQNEALVLYRDGYLGVAGTQTSRTSSERPYPGLVFPANKVPTAIAVTTANEFALVTVWDTDTHTGQLAVIALEGKFLAFHTWPYVAMPNQGSWSGFKLLGYIDLPMRMPTAVAAASNGWWSGPSQTGGRVLSQIDLSNDAQRKLVYSGDWSAVVAKGGYAIVASKYDNTVAVVDLSPLFSYIRESYLSSAASFNQTMAARGWEPADFPQAFSIRPSITPKIVWQAAIEKPTAVLAGLQMDRWTKDYFKAYVAAEDGTISIIDTSPLMKRYSYEKLGSLRIAGSFNVGKNPVSMCFARRGEPDDLPLLPYATDGSQYKPDPLNNLFYVAVRGDRKVVAAVTFGGEGAVYRTIEDQRMGDPVAVSTAVRGPILSVADFRGKKIVSFRIGNITDARNGKTYGCGADGTAPFEFAGELPFYGYPFLINSTNVN